MVELTASLGIHLLDAGYVVSFVETATDAVPFADGTIPYRISRFAPGDAGGLLDALAETERFAVSDLYDVSVGLRPVIRRTGKVMPVFAVLGGCRRSAPAASASTKVNADPAVVFLARAEMSARQAFDEIRTLADAGWRAAFLDEHTSVETAWTRVAFGDSVAAERWRLMAVVSPPRPATRPGAPRRTRPRSDIAERRDQAHRLWSLTSALIVFYVVTVSTLSPLLDGASWWLGVAMLGAIVLCLRCGRPVDRRQDLGRHPHRRRRLAGAARALLRAGGLVRARRADLRHRRRLRRPRRRTACGRSPAQGTPAEADIGIRFVLAVGAGAFALLLDAVAVAARMPAFVGIPAVAIALVPGFVQGDVNLLALAVCGAAYLSCSGRTPGCAASPGSVRAGLLGIGAIAVVGSLVFAAAAPGFNGESLLPSSGGSVFGRGVSPLVDLGKDLRRPGGAQQFSYTTTTDESLYFRLLTLDEFNGTTWSGGKRPRSAPERAGHTAPVPGLSDEIETEPRPPPCRSTGWWRRGCRCRSRACAWSARTADGSGTSTGLTLSSRLSSASGQSFIAESVLIKPTREQLIAAQPTVPGERRPVPRTAGRDPTDPHGDSRRGDRGEHQRLRQGVRDPAVPPEHAVPLLGGGTRR